MGQDLGLGRLAPGMDHSTSETGGEAGSDIEDLVLNNDRFLEQLYLFSL